MIFKLIEKDEYDDLKAKIDFLYEMLQRVNVQYEVNAPFISRKMVVRRYGISLNTIDKWRLEGLIEWKQIGERRILIDVASLDEYINGL
mgnify:CR=1 FL=1